MIQIRQNFFETNSSSCHALIIPRDQDFKVRSTIDLSEDSETGDDFRRFLREELIYEEDVRKFICLLYSAGVETIKYNGRNEFVTKYIKECKGTTQFEGLPNFQPNYDWGEKWDKEDWLRFVFGEENYHFEGYTEDMDSELGDEKGEEADSVCWMMSWE